MSIFETLTNEDLPLNFRFPRFSTRVKYPTNSVVLFDASSTDDPIYRVYISIAAVDPNRVGALDPVASIVANQNLWRDITGRHITDISGQNLDSETIEFTFTFDEGVPTTFPIDVSNLGRGGVRLLGDTTNTLYQNVAGIGDSDSNVTIRPSSDGTTLEFSVSTTVESNSAMFIDSDGNLNFNEVLLNAMGQDSDLAASRIRSFLKIGDTPLIFEENSLGEHVLTKFRESDGTELTIRNTFFRVNGDQSDGIAPRSNNGNLLVLTFAAFDPSFSVFAIDDNTNDARTGLLQASPTYLWDRPALGFAVTIDNPDDTPGEHIIIDSVAEVSGGEIETTLINYQQIGTHTTSGASQTVRYLANQTDALIRPDVTLGDRDTEGGTVTGRVTLTETHDNAMSFVAHDTGDFTITWNAPPANAIVSVNNNGNLPSIVFLGIHRTASYTVTQQAGSLFDSSNFSVDVAGSNGVITNNDGSGNITFSVPIHKDTVISTADRPQIAVTNIEYSRPATVTGDPYTVSRPNQSAALTLPTSSGYSFPSFWFVNSDTFITPALANIVANSGTGQNLTADFIRASTSTFDTILLNGQINVRSGGNDNVSRLGTGFANTFIALGGNNVRFWYGIRTSAIDPNVGGTPIVAFDVRDPSLPSNPNDRTEANDILVSSNNVTVITVLVSPTGLGTSLVDAAGYAGYDAVSYTLYGVLTNGNVSAINIVT